ncbi:MAG: hypothetical protein KTR30_17955 [Saprospiraceae bacterium]|nr:hypothetical protein [Saprospiraceae bacterium]
MKRTLKIALIGFCFLLVFRGQVFRLCFVYVPIEQVQFPDKSDTFRTRVKESIAIQPTASPQKHIALALRYTAQHLSFTTASSSSDPIQLLKRPKANCMGYANFFEHCLRHQLRKTAVEENYELQQWRGKLHLFGWDIHSLFQSPFWKDHDFNIIIDNTSGQQMAVDATLYDYFRIRSVRLQTPRLP